ncbi:MAG: hypothetical protein AAB443_03515 [Patescibacteria group bacterium]
MYIPEFLITTNILRSIGKVEYCRAVLEEIPIQENISSNLQKEALAKNVFHAHHFDASAITLQTVRQIIDTQNVQVSQKLNKELNSYKKVYEDIPKLGKLDLQSLKKMHRNLLEDLAPDFVRGTFRTTALISNPNNIINPAPDEILARLTSFFEWFLSHEAMDLPTPLRTAVLYLEIFRISPFEIENKKMAGLASLLDLYVEKYDTKRVLALEWVFDESPTGFYFAVKTTQNQTGDITKWLEYFLFGLASEYERVKEKILTLAKDAKLRRVAGMTPLNDRQEKILEFIHDFGQMQNKDFSRLFPQISEDTILRDLKDLIVKNLVEKVGSTKSSRYRLKDNQNKM